MACYDAGHCHVALDLLQHAGGALSLAELANALGEHRRGEAIAMAMMVGRLVDIDLSAPISGASRIRAVAETIQAKIQGAAQ